MVRAPDALLLLISVISPHLIRFSLRNQKCCSTPSWVTTIVPGRLNSAAAAAKSVTASNSSLQGSPDACCLKSLKATHAGKTTISGQINKASASGENSKRPSPRSFALRSLPFLRICIHKASIAVTKLAIGSVGFHSIEIILNPTPVNRRPPEIPRRHFPRCTRVHIRASKEAVHYCRRSCGRESPSQEE